MARANWRNWIGAAIILAVAAVTIAFLWRQAGSAREIDDKTVLRAGDQRGGSLAFQSTGCSVKPCRSTIL